MSDSSANHPRPVSLITVFAIFGMFALFLLLIKLAYLPKQAGVYAGDGVRTPEQRRAVLAELQAKQMKQAASYGWVDQKAGVVQLPIDRAIELTVQQYGKK
jgi:hypothetical protein